MEERYPNDLMLYAIDLADSASQISESPVSRTFEKVDMKLSRLRSGAARIMKTIRDAHEARKQEISISPPDKDKLCKFLFIMKYRGSTVHRRFYHQDPDNFAENDQEELRIYIREKGHMKPIDVWFNNIKVPLEMEMEPEKR